MKHVYSIFTVVALMALVFNLTPAEGAKKYDGKTLNVYLGITPYAREQVMEHIAPKLKEKWGIDLAAEAGGQGLALHSTMMAVIGGELTVESRAGGGTVVRLIIRSFVVDGLPFGKSAENP